MLSDSFHYQSKFFASYRLHTHASFKTYTLKKNHFIQIESNQLNAGHGQEHWFGLWLIYMSFASLGKHQPPILENAKLQVKNKFPYLSEN